MTFDVVHALSVGMSDWQYRSCVLIRTVKIERKYDSSIQNNDSLVLMCLIKRPKTFLHFKYSYINYSKYDLESQSLLCKIKCIKELCNLVDFTTARKTIPFQLKKAAWLIKIIFSNETNIPESIGREINDIGCFMLKT